MMIVPNGPIGQVAMLHVELVIRLVPDNAAQIVAVRYQPSNSHVTQIPYARTIVQIVKIGLSGAIAVLTVVLGLKHVLNHVATQAVLTIPRVELATQM